MPDTNRRRSSRHLRLLVRATRQIPVSASPPRPGIVMGAAISFGFGAVITAAFRPWGWGVCRLDSGAHVLLAPRSGAWVWEYTELGRRVPAIVRRNRSDHDHYFLAKSPPLLVGNADLGVQRLRALHRHGHLLLVVAAIHRPTDVADVADESEAGGTHNTPPTSFLSIRS